MEAAIQVRGLRKSYKDLDVLKGVVFRLVEQRQLLFPALVPEIRKRNT